MERMSLLVFGWLNKKNDTDTQILQKIQKVNEVMQLTKMYLSKRGLVRKYARKKDY